MDESRKVTTKDELGNDPTAPVQTRRGEQNQVRLINSDELASLLDEESVAPNALVMAQTLYQKNNQVSTQAEFVPARDLFAYILRSPTAGACYHGTIEKVQNSNGDVFKRTVMRESFELPCVMSCFLSLKRLFC